jgi:hypothetical protein
MHSRLRTGLIATTAFLFVTVLGAADRWAALGSRSVTDRVDHDTIVVTGAKGDFNAIKLTVQRSAVRFYRVVVHYRNGGQQEIQLRNVIEAGGETRVIDLRGKDRVIKAVDFWYEAKSIGRRGAVVRLFGRHGS